MHRFGHIEIPTTSIRKAKKFYGDVFGWKFTDYPEIRYTLFRTGSRPNGGFDLVRRMPGKGQVNVYIEVGKIKTKLAQIRKAGGTVVKRRTRVPGMGWFAVFKSPDGCALSLWEPRSRR